MKSSLIFLAFLLGVLALWLGCFYTAAYVFHDLTSAGQFGDSFGVVNALFSGCAFAALVYTVILQRRDLGVQREELRLQREEMKGSRDALVDQARAQMLQVKTFIVQVRIAGLQAELEAQKMDSEQFTPGGRHTHVEAIRRIAQHIAAEADELERITTG